MDGGTTACAYLARVGRRVPRRTRSGRRPQRDRHPPVDGLVHHPAGRHPRRRHLPGRREHDQPRSPPGRPRAPCASTPTTPGFATATSTTGSSSTSTAGVSNRLTGGPGSTASPATSRRARAGATRYAITILLDPALDDPEGARAWGPTRSSRTTGGAGIRPRRYSRDMAIQPFTYDSIKTGMARRDLARAPARPRPRLGGGAVGRGLGPDRQARLQSQRLRGHGTRAATTAPSST